jgi:CheY-like chemotaxis protein
MSVARDWVVYFGIVLTCSITLIGVSPALHGTYDPELDFRIQYSREMYTIFACTTAISFPMICDLFTSKFSGDNFYENFALIISLAITGITFLWMEASCSNCHFFGAVMTLYYILRIVSVGATVFLIYRKASRTPLPFCLSCTFILLYALSSILYSSDHQCESVVTPVLYSVSYAASMGVFVAAALYRVCSRSGLSDTPESNSDAYIGTLMALVVLTEFARLASSSSSTACWMREDESSISAYIVIQMIFAVLVYSLSSRLEPHKDTPNASMTTSKSTLELKTRMNLLYTGLSLMQRGGSADREGLINYLVLLCSDVLRAVRLSENAHSDTRVVRRVSVSNVKRAPEALAREQLHLLQLIASEKHISLVVQDNSSLPANAFVAFDDQLLPSVFQRILSQLLMHTARGESVDIVLEASSTPGVSPLVDCASECIGTVSFAISSSGSTHLVDPYGDDSVEAANIMSLAEQILLNNGGRLSRGLNDVWIITLPLLSPRPLDGELTPSTIRNIASLNDIKEASSDAETVRVSMAGSKHLLVVDDAKLTLRIISQNVLAQGHTCDTATDGTGCVSIIKRSQYEGGRVYDAVLIDYCMPNMEGPTAIQLIKEMGYRGVIIGMTGNPAAAFIQEFTAKGALEVMIKPITPDKIAKIVKMIEYNTNDPSLLQGYLTRHNEETDSF